MVTTRGRVWTSVASVASILVLAACGTNQDEAASAVAEQLLAAASDDQGARACSLLAPGAVKELEDSSGQPCAQAILGEDLGAAGPPEGVRVFDTMAQVRFETDTVFLSRFDGEWLVIAAACVPQEGRPFDCAIQVS